MKLKTGIELITDERNRQINEERYSDEHDDEHAGYELTRAAVCYALYAIGRAGVAERATSRGDGLWPWSYEDERRAKRGGTDDDRMKQLAKAGALISAELDRMQRARKPQPLAVGGHYEVKKLPDGKTAQLVIYVHLSGAECCHQFVAMTDQVEVVEAFVRDGWMPEWCRKES